MSDLINRKSALKALRPIMRKSDYFYEIQKAIQDIPPAEPERKKGSWNVIQGNIVVCSECGMLAPKSMTGCLLNRHLEPNRTNFCPNCGADMRGEKHETD